MIDHHALWIVIFGLGIGSYALRFTFLGLIGDRQLPEWLLRHLRYTAVTVLPALVAPQVLWPAGTGGQLDPARLSAACVALLAGVVFRKPIAAIAAGFAALYLVPLITG
ncbi:AzlD domain-containing protein [Pseudooceanicola sp. CBS1P-1]|uniref:AzlD domain-containing protein n=1 Tax=Pseudooceanicola albus TaxID=2692189 RepID=A0A6L7G3R9_9RHOB|nr:MULTISPECIES: AzlD domain-containing protein [Pseudooceanicola]MBT9384849.1 AzlD domain-containing protein [Pseudooceanicola endophyticus]MXN18157.1 AzlD domain-containing protein [Pseudooceanicola albus]